VGHDVDDDSLRRKGFVCIPRPYGINKKNINQANMELAHLLDILDQTPEVEERIREVMKRINTYKVITIISSGFIFMS
jgi:hypothetical protein